MATVENILQQLRTILTQLRRIKGIFDAKVAENELVYLSASTMAGFSLGPK
jgi:hypothetical protein